MSCTKLRTSFPSFEAEKANIMQVLDIVLIEEQIQFLENVISCDPGFPHFVVGILS